MPPIKRGDRVVDKYGNKGVVVWVIEGVDQEDHGGIAVWQEERYNYGLDNCEHYVHYGWENSLTILEE